jgi:sulfur-oxidizing protein SoxY
MQGRPGEADTTRRALLRGLGVVGLGGVLAPAPGLRPASAQGHLADLGPEETVEATVKRLFAGRPIKDGSAAVKLELPLIAENGAVVPVTVEVAAPMTPQHHVKAVYIISDKNRRPLNAKFTLTPAVGQAYVATNLRLGESTDVRAVVELSDGTLLQVRRGVQVSVGGCGG